MSQIRTAKAVDIAAFPGSTFVINDTPPIAQCQEADIIGINGITQIGLTTITEVGKFIGIDLAGKDVVITFPAGDAGTYTVLSNTDDVLITDHTFANATAAAVYQVKDAAGVYLTRNESSFTRYIEAQSKAHTTKGGQLYTNLTDPPMNAACSDTWNPE